MYCRNCGNEVNEKAVACLGCGMRPKSEKNFCPSCGTETKVNQVICIKCGVGLSSYQDLPKIFDKFSDSPKGGFVKLLIAFILFLILHYWVNPSIEYGVIMSRGSSTWGLISLVSILLMIGVFVLACVGLINIYKDFIKGK